MNKYTLGFLLTFSLLSPSLSQAATAQEYTDMGTALFQKGLYDKSVVYFKEAVQADPNDWQAYEDLGNAYAKMNDNTDALDAYQKSLQINSDNPTLQTLVDNLKASPATQDQSNFNSLSQDHPAAAPAPSNGGNWVESQPTTVVIQRRRALQQAQPVVDYKDGLPAMDHARVWTKFNLGYVNARVGDLNTSANNWNTDIANNGWTGSASMGTDAYSLGFELGFLMNPNSGIALGVHYIGLNDYKLNVNYQNGPFNDGTNTYDSDYDQTTLTPYAIPFTLDYYLFLPDSSGRFFLSAGVGYYFGTVHVERSYSGIIDSFNNNDPNYANNFDQYSGDLTAGAVGFQASIGREWAISPNMGFTLYAKGQYAKITNFSGVITDVNGSTANVGLAVEPSFNNEVYVEDQTQIGGGNGNHNATVDFTSVEVGFALNFYSF